MRVTGSWSRGVRWSGVRRSGRAPVPAAARVPARTGHPPAPAGVGGADRRAGRCRCAVRLVVPPGRHYSKRFD